MSSEPRARGGFPVFKLGLIALVSYCGMEAARGIYHIRNPDCPAAAPGDAPDARVRALEGCLETSRGERGATFHAPVWANRGSGTRFSLYLVEYRGDAWLRLVAATDLTRRPPWDTVFVQADGR